MPVKVKLPKGTKVSAVAAGAFYSLAVTSTGSVLAWGYNSKGQLGDGKTASTDRPVKVKLPKGTKVTAVAAGYYHSLALTSTGSVLAWGADGEGQLGDGRTAKSRVPVKVKLPKRTTVTAVAAGGMHSLALTARGSVLAWGANGHGELGDGNSTQSRVPVKVKLGTSSKAIAIAAGFSHSLAVTSTGSVLAWGDNGSGQLGDGRSTESDLPVSVKLPKGSKVTAVGAGYYHSLAVTAKGSVLAWGNNFYGQLGNGSTTGSDVPVKVKLPKGTTVHQVAAGHGHSGAL